MIQVGYDTSNLKALYKDGASCNACCTPGGGFSDVWCFACGTEESSLDAGDAVDVSIGVVGLPMTAHSIGVGDQIAITGTTFYDGVKTVSSTSANQVNIVATYSPETFDGSERVFEGTLLPNFLTLTLDILSCECTPYTKATPTSSVSYSVETLVDRYKITTPSRAAFSNDSFGCKYESNLNLTGEQEVVVATHYSSVTDCTGTGFDIEITAFHELVVEMEYFYQGVNEGKSRIHVHASPQLKAPGGFQLPVFDYDSGLFEGEIDCFGSRFDNMPNQAACLVAASGLGNALSHMSDDGTGTIDAGFVE